MALNEHMALTLDHISHALASVPLEIRRGSARYIEVFLQVAILEGQNVGFYSAMIGEPVATTTSILDDLERQYGLLAEGEEFQPKDRTYSLTDAGSALARNIIRGHLRVVE